MIVTIASWDTVEVVIGNVAWVWPAGTVTVAGVVAATLLLANATISPPVGAGELKTTVPTTG